MFVNGKIPSNFTQESVDIALLREQLRNRKKDKRLGSDGYQAIFENFVSKYDESCSVVEYRSPQASWDQYMGSQGYAIVKDGVVIAAITTRMN